MQTSERVVKVFVSPFLELWVILLAVLVAHILQEVVKEGNILNEKGFTIANEMRPYQLYVDIISFQIVTFMEVIVCQGWCHDFSDRG